MTQEELSNLKRIQNTVFFLVTIILLLISYILFCPKNKQQKINSFTVKKEIIAEKSKIIDKEINSFQKIIDSAQKTNVLLQNKINDLTNKLKNKKFKSAVKSSTYYSNEPLDSIDENNKFIIDTQSEQICNLNKEIEIKNYIITSKDSIIFLLQKDSQNQKELINNASDNIYKLDSDIKKLERKNRNKTSTWITIASDIACFYIGYKISK